MKKTAVLFLALILGAAGFYTAREHRFQTRAEQEIRPLLSDKFPAEFTNALIDLNVAAQKAARRTHLTFAQNPPAAFAGLSDDFLNFVINAAIKTYGDAPDGALTISQAENGFYAAAFDDENGTIVIAFRGSNEMGDMPSDWQIMTENLPDQFTQADAFYRELAQKYPQKRFVLTGHSLGGSLAQLVGAKHPETLALACNPAGTKTAAAKSGFQTDGASVYNLVTRGDSFANALEHVGVNRQIGVKKDANGIPLPPHSILNCLSPFAD